MRIVIILFAIFFLFSCAKEKTSPLAGYWTLVDVDYVYTDRADIDTAGWFKTGYTYDGDSLYWVSESYHDNSYSIQQQTMWYKLVMIINAENEVTIDNNIVLKHYDKWSNKTWYSENKNETLFLNVEEGTFDRTKTGGEVYDYKFAFGLNSIFIAGDRDENTFNILYVQKDEISDTLVLKYNYKMQYDSSTLKGYAEYTFVRQSFFDGIVR